MVAYKWPKVHMIYFLLNIEGEKEMKQPRRADQGHGTLDQMKAEPSWQETY